ncbi:unnamed protein product [Psylliodes chrysocephalus]|uniref:Uncharacterized protein n=1 Tax=Psylliodes chrysocephalus TaxID=3402493 RepID=A0A9P0D6R4_9CUCU|nr:unnamed protein product [Psylliodes chrysocephala]
MNRFGCVNNEEIDCFIDNITPKNTIKSRNSVWNQFMKFCVQRKYVLSNDKTVAELCNILKDWAGNMKKEDGSDYKEYSLKYMWNSTAKTLQEIYLKKFNMKIDLFQGIEFKSAPDAQNAKRRELQNFSEKRKQSSTALSLKHIHDIIDKLDEQTPDCLQKILFTTIYVMSLLTTLKVGKCHITHLYFPP